MGLISNFWDSEKPQDTLSKINIDDEIDKAVKRIQENGILSCAAYNAKDGNLELTFQDINGNKNTAKISVSDLCDTPSAITLSSEDCTTCAKTTTSTSTNFKGVTYLTDVDYGLRTDCGSPTKWAKISDSISDCCNKTDVSNVVSLMGSCAYVDDLKKRKDSKYGDMVFVNSVKKWYAYTQNGWECLGNETILLGQDNTEENKPSEPKRQICKSTNTYYSSVYNKKKRNLVRV